MATQLSGPTPGPWRLGCDGDVVSDHPVEGMPGSDDVAYYGGHLICESVTPANAALIVEAVNELRAQREVPAGCPGWHLEDDEKDDQEEDDRGGSAFLIVVAICAGTLVLEVIGLVYALLRLVLA